MKSILTYLRDFHSQLFKAFLFLLATAFIVYIFPHESKFKYEFIKGKPWPHEDLIAPFDYPIYKSKAQLNDEKEAIEQEKKTYFFKNVGQKAIALSDFYLAFDDSWESHLDQRKGIRLRTQSLKASLQKKGDEIINHIYQKGIVALHESISDQPKDYVISVLESNEAQDAALQDLYTIQEAYDYVEKEVKVVDEVDQLFLIQLIEEQLKQNIQYDEATNDLALEEALEKISPTQGLVQKGERVISNGDLLNENKFQLVESLKKETELLSGSQSKQIYIILGQSVLVALMILSLVLFLMTYRKEIMQSDLKISFLLFQIVLYVSAAKWAISVENVSIYLVPFVMLPLIIRTFFDIRVALFTYLVCILIVGFIAPNPYEFIMLEMATGMITLFSINSLRNRSQLFLSSLLIFIVYSLCYLSIGLIQEGSFEASNWKFLAWFFGSAMLSLFTYPFIYIFEKIFGFVSDLTLMELADTNGKLLRKLNLKAPGTFQHSLQVSNLAEEAIRTIGGNPLLVRTGALYHDIGKMNMPNYFIENQNSDYNPHADLSPEESAEIIVGHVIDGIEIARRNKLPDIIIDFIRTHHGTTKTQYFLKQFRQENPEADIDESVFQYPGPIPYSKETAVLMMADSVEAASRSLKKYDADSISNLVNGIINYQVAEQQFVQADITYKDVTLLKKMFIKKLMSIYHVRVEYPE